MHETPGQEEVTQLTASWVMPPRELRVQSFFLSQEGGGDSHTSCFLSGALRALCKLVGFSSSAVSMSWFHAGCSAAGIKLQAQGWGIYNSLKPREWQEQKLLRPRGQGDGALTRVLHSYPGTTLMVISLTSAQAIGIGAPSHLIDSPGLRV